MEHHTEIQESVRDALTTVGGVWAILTIAFLASGPHRYRDTKRGVAGINDRMLSQTLQRFTRDGLVVRHGAEKGSNAVTYELSAVGQRVSVALCEFIAVMREVAPSVHEARQRHDATSP